MQYIKDYLIFFHKDIRSGRLLKIFPCSFLFVPLGQNNSNLSDS